jgi:hypothetical protein
MGLPGPMGARGPTGPEGPAGLPGKVKFLSLFISILTTLYLHVFL